MCPTVNQLVRKPRRPKRRKSNTPALDRCPFKRGVILRTYTVDPKKPNSADRKMARVRLSNGKEVTCYIPGQGHEIIDHMDVLVRGGKTPDVGAKYKIVRGTAGDPGEKGPHISGSTSERAPRHKKRSKYGVRKRDMQGPVAT